MAALDIRSAWSLACSRCTAAARYVRAVERRGEANAEQRQLIERVADLEGALEEARTEIARLDAAQEFTTRLLAERSRESV